ncbi:MAG: transposase [Chloroflexi bacterium]|nr:transposase [Chloroflexota bacterium]
MARRKYILEQIIRKLREVEVALAQGSTVALAARGIGVTDQNYYRWRREDGGLTVREVTPCFPTIALLSNNTIRVLETKTP